MSSKNELSFNLLSNSYIYMDGMNYLAYFPVGSTSVNFRILGSEIPQEASSLKKQEIIENIAIARFKDFAKREAINLTNSLFNPLDI